MKNTELNYCRTHHLNLEGEEELVAGIKVVFDRLIDHLLRLPEDTDQPTILACFKQCMLDINDFEQGIETVERESIFENIYALGEIMGLDPATEYAEEWRGDW